MSLWEPINTSQKREYKCRYYSMYHHTPACSMQNLHRVHWLNTLKTHKTYELFQGVYSPPLLLPPKFLQQITQIGICLFHFCGLTPFTAPPLKIKYLFGVFVQMSWERPCNTFAKKISRRGSFFNVGALEGASPQQCNNWCQFVWFATKFLEGVNWGSSPPFQISAFGLWHPEIPITKLIVVGGLPRSTWLLSPIFLGVHGRSTRASRFSVPLYHIYYLLPSGGKSKRKGHGGRASTRRAKMTKGVCACKTHGPKLGANSLVSHPRESNMCFGNNTTLAGAERKNGPFSWQAGTTHHFFGMRKGHQVMWHHSNFYHIWHSCCMLVWVTLIYSESVGFGGTVPDLPTFSVRGHQKVRSDVTPRQLQHIFSRREHAELFWFVVLTITATEFYRLI